MTHELLAGFPVLVEDVVRWGDMDAYQHTNNTIFFQFFESARVAYFLRCGLLKTFDEDGVGGILRSTECRFRSPLTYPDTVITGARVVQVDRDRFAMAYATLSHKKQELVATGTGIVVCYDYRHASKTSLPEAIRLGIQRVEDGLE